MADLPSVLPDLQPLAYARLLPSLEAAHVRTVDLLTLDGAEIARRARLPLSDVLRLCDVVARALQADLEGLRSAGDDFVRPRPVISTLDDAIDAALGGGVPTGYITEVTGERQVLWCAPHSRIGADLTANLAAPERPSSSSTFSWRRSCRLREASAAPRSTSRPSLLSRRAVSFRCSRQIRSCPRRTRSRRSIA